MPQFLRMLIVIETISISKPEKPTVCFGKSRIFAKVRFRPRGLGILHGFGGQTGNAHLPHSYRGSRTKEGTRSVARTAQRIEVIIKVLFLTTVGVILPEVGNARRHALPMKFKLKMI